MQDYLEHVVGHLSSFERRPASEGERRSAEWIADELRSAGYEAVVEGEPAVGGYWWQLATLNGLAALAALTRSRPLQVLAGAAAARGAWDELGLHRGWTRALMPRRTTHNVWAVAGEPGAVRTLVLAAHHDAAPGGVFFDQTLARAIATRFPGWIEQARTWPRVLWSVPFAGALVALGGLTGSRRLARLGAGATALAGAGFANIGLSPISPGANDNLTSVAALLALARRLAAEPVAGLRVVLLFPGSEESFEEGMAAWLDRHAPPPEQTDVLAIEMLGSGRLVVVEGEGMLTRVPYDAALKDLLAAAAGDAGVPALREHWAPFGSDALAAIRRGYRAAMFTTFDEQKLPANYHSPDDTAANVDFASVGRGLALLEAAVRRHAAAPGVAPA
jgi:hypothetical protein